MWRKTKTVVTFYKVVKRRRKHERTVTLDLSPRNTWKALRYGLHIRGIDLDGLRAQRKRKGGRR